MLVVSDLFILGTIVFFSVAIRIGLLPRIFHSTPPFEFQPSKYGWIFPLWLIVLAYNGAYTKRFTLWDEVRTLWKTTFIISVAAVTLLFIGKEGASISRALLFSGCFLSLFFFPLMRLAMKRLIYWMGFFKRKLLILGSGDAALWAFRAVQKEKNLGYDVAGFIGDGSGGDGETGHNGERIEGIKVHGFLDKAQRYIDRCSIHDVMIAVPDLNKDRLANIINRVQRKAENTLFMSDMSAVAVMGAELRYFGGQEGIVIEIKNNLRRLHNYILKKLFDYTIGLALSAILLLPILVIALIVKATSSGPAIFKQRRISKNGRAFWCYKFRTMYEDAEKRLENLFENDPSARQEWQTYRKLKNDPRVTGLGRFLRATSLDELPQIFNMLKGEMSFVGPRPVTQEEIDIYYKENATLCFSVLPGITGLWQVSGRNEMDYENRVKLDLWYVRNWNMWLDIVILLKTVRVVLSGEGSRDF